MQMPALLRRRSAPHILAEVVVPAADGFARLVLPLGGLSSHGAGQFDIWLADSGTGDYRHCRLGDQVVSGRDRIALLFPPFARSAGRRFLLVAFRTPPGEDAPRDTDYARFGPELARQAGDRTPIDLDCGYAGAGVAAPGGILFRGPQDMLAAGAEATTADDDAVIRRVALAGGGAVSYAIDHHWCDAFGLYLVGWLEGGVQPVEAVAFDGGVETAALETYPRPDIRRDGGAHAVALGFKAYLPWHPGRGVTCVARIGGARVAFPLALPRRDAPQVEAADRWSDFVAAMNKPGLTVLELGARAVGPQSFANRAHFTAARYLGMDIHAAPGVEVVGDAHHLSELVGEGSLDGVFSIAVLEHLAYPWLLAAQVNKALKPGGLTYHTAPQSWPVHETPNDFWRFSDEGLKVLFGAATGFEVLDAGMRDPVRMHMDWRRPGFYEFPFEPGFGNAYILARKVREIDLARFAWPVSATEMEDLARLYPVHLAP